MEAKCWLAVVVVLACLDCSLMNDCQRTDTITVTETLGQNVHVKGLNCNLNVCGGDVFIGENPLELVGASTNRVGLVDGVCTVMNTLDRALCRWTMFFPDTNSELQVTGVSYPKAGNDSEVIVVGGTGDYQGVTGSGTTYLIDGQQKRYFEFFLCYPDTSVKQRCHVGQISYKEIPPIRDVVVPAVPGKWSVGAVDLFNNSFSADANTFLIQSGQQNGQCTFLGERWFCQWNVLLPYENNKLLMQGSIKSAPDSPASVPVVGGSGVFGGVRGAATVTGKQLQANVYYWEVSASFLYGCLSFSGMTRVSFREVVGNSRVVPSKRGNGAAPTEGDVRIIFDDLHFMNYKRSEENEADLMSRRDTSDGKLTGTCTLLAGKTQHYCEWIVEYPYTGYANGRGSNQILLAGTVSDNPKSFSTIAVIGGSGLWGGAIGWGTYQTYVANPNDSQIGSNVASFELEFMYIAA